MLKIFLIVAFLFTSFYTEAKVRSVRFKVSRPATLHTLVFKDPNKLLPKTTYELIPKNNNRIGFFVSLNSLLIGYSFDPFKNSQETKTIDLDFSTEKFDNMKVGFNFQLLEGFDSKAESQFSNEEDRVYVSDIKSTKLELYGIHNFIDLHNKSRFNHFYLNRPVDAEEFFGFSIVGNWNIRHLKLESPNGLVYTPNFFTQPVTESSNAKELKAFSASFSAGPMFSLSLKNRVNAFLAAKLGTGYFTNLSDDTDLKSTGFETLQSYSLGLSWNNKHKNLLINSRFSFQKGRHIETSFGEVALIFFL